MQPLTLLAPLVRLPMLGLLVCLSGCTAAMTAGAGDLPIFPGAQGFGIYGPAGRGGEIMHVTTLRDSGPGSLRACLNASGPRVCVFDVSGTIRTHKQVRIYNPFVTIAGETAPSPGILIRGAGMYIKTHDVLVRHLRIRVGDDPRGPPPNTRDGLAIHSKEQEIYNVVCDHMSVSWAVDENMEFWYTTHDSTLSNSIVSEALFDSIHTKGPHSRALMVGGDQYNISVLGTLFAHNNRRNPRVEGGARVVFANNLVYGWRGAAGEWGTPNAPLDAAIVGNVYIRNAQTPDHSKPVTVSKTLPAGGHLFIDDNIDGKLPADPWSLVWLRTKHPIKASKAPLWPPGFVALPAHQVKEHVLASAGARPNDRDAVDLRVVRNVRRKTGGMIDSPADVGGWPRLAENRRRFQPPPNPNGDDDGDGYTNLEEKLHRLAEDLLPGR